MPVILGYIPDALEVQLIPSSTFTSALINPEQTWPGAVELRFDVGTVWTASVDGASASWTVLPASVNALLALQPQSVTLWFRDGASDIKAALGTVRVVG